MSINDLKCNENITWSFILHRVESEYAALLINHYTVHIASVLTQRLQHTGD